jgi:hypothetical protein
VRDLAVLLLHLLATVARLAGPGGARSVVAESFLVKHQLLILSVSNSLSGRYWELDQIPAVETQRTLCSSARATVCPPAKVNWEWPSNDTWLRVAL